MTTKPLRRWRRFAAYAQAAIVVGLPFITIRGESALRYDVDSLALHFFGTAIMPGDYFIILVGLLAFTFAFAWTTLVFGRIWCGWTCPQTILVDMTGGKRAGAVRRYTTAVALSLLVGANLIWYFTPPREFADTIMIHGAASTTFKVWMALAVVVFLDLAILGRTFCKTICPYARLQDAMSDDATMVVAYDKRRDDECNDCAACEAVCPVDVAIREGLSGECIACAECRDACAESMARKDNPSLVNYVFGKPGGAIKLFRPISVALISATIASVAFTVYLGVARKPVEALVMPNGKYLARTTEGGAIVNSFVAVITNRDDRAIEYALSASADGAAITISPATITIAARERKDAVIYIVVKKTGAKFPEKATIMFVSKSPEHSRDIESAILLSAP